MWNMHHKKFKLDRSQNGRLSSVIYFNIRVIIMVNLPAKPGYSHCVEPGRSDRHFSTAGCVKQTLTQPTEKTERGVGHMQLARC